MTWSVPIQYLEGAIPGRVSGVVIAGVGEEGDGRVDVGGCVDGVTDQALEVVDLDRHVWVGAQGVEHPCSAVGEIHPILETRRVRFRPPLVRYGRLNSEKSSCRKRRALLGILWPIPIFC